MSDKVKATSQGKPTSYTYISDDEIRATFIAHIGTSGRVLDSLYDTLWSSFRKTHTGWALNKQDEWYLANRLELVSRCSMVRNELKELLVSNDQVSIRLKELSIEIDETVHATPSKTHGFTKDDVMAATALLHAVVMDVAAPKQLKEVGVEEAKKLAFDWGKTLHDQVLKMTGVDMYDYREAEEEE